MIVFLIISAIYVGTLLFLRPSPNSLKAAPLTFAQNMKEIKASLFSGLLVLCIFLVTSNFTFISIDEKTYRYLALNNDWEMASLWPLQAITHLFIHVNLIHLISNTVGLGIASVYERRVGSRRFITILVLAGIASMPSIIFYQSATSVCGISGGVFGLAAAYFTDHDDLTTKEWLYAIISFTFLVIVFTVEGEMHSNSNNVLPLKVDHIGHAFGAISAIIYCRLTRRHSTDVSTRTGVKDLPAG